jgi:hypothetical protein
MLQIDVGYKSITAMLELIDDPYRNGCKRIYADYKELFEATPGSTHNHQTWIGGYIDHVTDGMNYACCLYQLDLGIGRPLKFTLSDALLIFFLHDLEKPWRIKVDANGMASNRSDLASKEAHKKFRELKLKEYGIELTPYLLNALTYVEGEINDYSSERRVMNELAAFCHKVDVWSARGWYDYPKIREEDEWVGAGRFRTTETND